jgi:hypothetical protein
MNEARPAGWPAPWTPEPTIRELCEEHDRLMAEFRVPLRRTPMATDLRKSPDIETPLPPTISPAPTPAPAYPGLDAVATEAIGAAMSQYVSKKLRPLQDEVAALRTANAELRGQVQALLTMMAAREPRGRADA